MWSKRGWAEHPAGEHSAAEGPQTPAHSEYAEPYHKSAKGNQQQPQAQNDSTKPAASHSHRSLFQIILSILYLIPGVQSGIQSISFFNAAVLGILGALAALIASAAGFTVLLTLLARWYLPATVTHVSLPMYFDYAAGPAAAGAWIPLLRPTPLASALSPPSQRVSAAAAGLNPIQFHGSLGPGSTLSFSSSNSGSMSSWGSDGGFLGLGFGPGSRAASVGAKQDARSSWLFRDRARSSSKWRSSVKNVIAPGVDVGAGVRVPEKDWLVPQRGKMGLKVVLELPGWPETDLVQVTSEVVSQQGIVLGRSTRTWVPKPKPLVFRLISAFTLGPWRAIGLLDDTVRVQLPMFDSFQNPKPPPGGWSTLKHALHPKSNTPEIKLPESPLSGSSPGSKSGVGGGVSDGHVVGPRAMWLRVTMIGRSAERGAPRVYRAAAVLDLKLGLLDRIAAALRPSLPACIFLLLGSTGLALGSGTTAAALLLAAYALYSAGSSIAAAGHDDGEDVETDEADDDHHHHRQQQQLEEEGEGEVEKTRYRDGTNDADLDFHRSVTAAGRARSSERLPASDNLYDLYSYPKGSVSDSAATAAAAAARGAVGAVRGSGVEFSSSRSGSGGLTADGRVLSHVDSDLGHAAGVLGNKQQVKDRAAEFANTDESSASSYDNYEDAYDSCDSVNGPATPAAAAAAVASAPQQQQQQQGQRQGWQQQQQQRSDGAEKSAVSAIVKMVESKQQQQRQQQQQAEEKLLHDAGVSGHSADADDEWQNQLLAESDGGDDDNGSSSSTTDLAAAAAARKGLAGQSATQGFVTGNSVVSVTGATSKRAGYAYQA